MVDYETFMKIRAAHEDGMTCSQIAQKLGLDDRTVHKWLEKARYSQRQSGIRSSKLDPFKDYIVRRLEEYPFSAAQIFQKLQEMEFTGGFTIVKDYVRKIRPKRVEQTLNTLS